MRKTKVAFCTDGHISDFNFPTLAGDESAMLRGNPDVFMNHHFYETKLPRKTIVGVTSIFPCLCALGGPLLRVVIECLETTYSSLFFTLLSRCQRHTITYQRVFKELLCLISERKTSQKLVGQLVEFAFAHLRALQPEARSNFQNGMNGTERIMCLADEATLFRRTFDIPSALDQINDGREDWRSISTQSKTNNFVVHRRQTTYESGTLRIGDNVSEIVSLLIKPRRKRWILTKFPAANRPTVSRAIDDLLTRGVLRECG